MRSRRKWLLVLALAGVLAVFVYQRPLSEGEFDETSRETVTTADADGFAHAVEPVGDEPEPALDTRGITRNGAPVAATDPSAPRTGASYSLPVDVRMSAWMEDYQESIRDSTREDFEQKQEEAKALDGEAAYWLYEFYSFCDRQPRSEWQLDNALSRVESRIERSERWRGNEWRLDRAQETLDEYEQGYQLCSFLGPDFDIKAAALAWLETAADLGHMGAMRLYHSQARRLLTEDDSTLGFQQPDLIHMFKSNARKYASQLLATGHPQGYLLMARMYYVGDVFKQDFNLAYAWAYAGLLAGTMAEQYDAQMWLRVIAQNLPPTNIRAAEKMARELLEQD